MICKDNDTDDYTHWFHKNIQFNGDYDYMRFRNSIINNPHFKLTKTVIHTEKKDYFNKIVETFVCIDCFNFFLLCSETTAEKLYKPPYYQQITVAKWYRCFVYLKIIYEKKKQHLQQA
ncbi:MAG: hypothetical protein IJV56_10215 [Neisseriaceae bacterium]|nr:hypothetical protein [Neisseriaceae bacterium]